MLGNWDYNIDIRLLAIISFPEIGRKSEKRCHRRLQLLGDDHLQLLSVRHCIQVQMTEQVCRL
jgi:hypothetical protein